jgi:hypothetical protein
VKDFTNNFKKLRSMHFFNDNHLVLSMPKVMTVLVTSNCVELIALPSSSVCLACLLWCAIILGTMMGFNNNI